METNKSKIKILNSESSSNKYTNHIKSIELTFNGNEVL